jgi:hypothetical protein
MKSKYARITAGALCAALLASCGGSDNGSLTLRVYVFGLFKPGLVLQNGDQTVTVNPGSSPDPNSRTEVYFPNLIAQDSTINVTVKTDAVATKCTPDPATATNVKANYYSALQVEVHCTTNSYKLGGTVTGLTKDQLVLTNGGNNVTIRPETPSPFVFPGAVYDGLNYGVTVLTQPEGLTCSVQNGVGTMPSGDVMNLAVTCVPKA